MDDVIIVGAGPAGLTAAIYLLRANKSVLVIEKNMPGGKMNMTSEIANYPGVEKTSGYELSKAMNKQALDLGMKYVNEEVMKVSKDNNVFTIKTDEGIHQAKALLVASGTEDKKLNIVGENEFLGRGVSYCATCDGFFYKDKLVALIGFNDKAVEEVNYLSNIAKKVIFLVIKDTDVSPIKNISVDIIKEAKPIEIKGDLKVRSLVYEANGIKKEVSVDGVFFDVGNKSSSSFLYEIIKPSQEGFIECNENMETVVSGLFIAGDMRKKRLRQITTATSDGAISATSIITYLRKI